MSWNVLVALVLAVGMTASGVEAAPREVNVHFRGLVDRGVPLDFGPAVPAMRVKVGEKRTVMYRVTNLSERPLELRAVRRVEPAAAERAVSKVKCLSLKPQTLGPYEIKVLPVEFRVESTLPGSVAELTLGYQIARSPASK